MTIHPDSPFARMLIEKFFTKYAEPYDEAQKEDLLDHLGRRCDKFRRLYAPWIATHLPRGAKTLEIGVGTGSASQVLAELGFAVDGIETDPEHSHIAEERLRLSGFSFRRMTIGSFPDVIQDIDISDYDAVFFWASFEHMTLEERVDGLRELWPRMRPGARLFIIECPNRIWHSDTHTGGIEFYHWVPDDLLLKMGINACRDREHLYRCGRAAGFHELRAAGVPVGYQADIDSLQLWTRRRNILKAIKWRLNGDGRHERRMHRAAPGIHREFFHEYIDIMVHKV